MRVGLINTIQSKIKTSKIVKGYLKGSITVDRVTAPVVVGYERIIERFKVNGQKQKRYK